MGALFPRWAVGAASILVVAGPALATTRTVTSLADSGSGSLRDTIAASGSGDTINFSVTGTITLTSGSLTVNHNLTIQGPGANSLTITRSSATHFRIFYFASGSWTLSDLTVDNGYDDVSSGGIYNGTGTLTVNNCIVQNCISGKGAGIGTSATTTLNNVFLIHNQCGVSGGGGVFNDGTLTMNNCTASNNTCLGNGGGLCNAGAITVTNSTFNDNTASGGGGIFNQNFQTNTVKNCTFSNNHGAGNGLRMGGGTLTVQSCTFSGNISEPGGTIEVVSGASLTIGGTILDGRGSTTNYPTLYVSSGTVTSQGYNLASDDGGGSLTATGDQINTDPKLDPFGLQYNGGYTDTIALTNVSPAIDKGKSFGLTSDQRGLARTTDNPNISNASGGDGTDIGAYEASVDPIEYGLIVNTTADHNDGVCGSDCTLREAIARAQTLSTNSPPVISFSIGLSGTIALNTNPIELDISTSMTILGPGARFLAISGNSAARVFTVSAGVITISGLTIRDGNYFTNQNHGETRQGGGVFNQANLTFNDCEFVNNMIDGVSNITNGGDGGTGQGGAIYNRSFLTLNGCTFSGNQAVGAAGNTLVSSQIIGQGGNGGAGQGGALFNDAGGTVHINNCTFNGNAATGGAGGAGNSPTILAAGGNADGAALCNFGSITVDSATVSGNIATGGSGAGSRFRHGANGGAVGGFAAKSGTSGIQNTILAGNTAPDAQGTFSSDGFNLIGIGDQSSGFSSARSDQIGTTSSPLNPHLGPLGSHGGPTDTMLLLYGSTAIDAGYTVLAQDQRGVARPIDTIFANVTFGGGVDIGAVEMNLLGGIDTDGDGMSDDFEIFYGFNPLNSADGGQDPDGDGLTNAQEYEFGTNPLDPASAFRITSVAYGNSTFTVEFGPTFPQKVYRLERRDSLDPASTWGSIPGLPDFTFAGSTGRIDDESATLSKYFYRIRTLP